MQIHERSTSAPFAQQRFGNLDMAAFTSKVPVKAPPFGFPRRPRVLSPCRSSDRSTPPGEPATRISVGLRRLLRSSAGGEPRTGVVKIRLSEFLPASKLFGVNSFTSLVISLPGPSSRPGGPRARARLLAGAAKPAGVRSPPCAAPFQFRLSTLLWITLAVACWFGGMRAERWLANREAAKHVRTGRPAPPQWLKVQPPVLADLRTRIGTPGPRPAKRCWDPSSPAACSARAPLAACSWRTTGSGTANRWPAHSEIAGAAPAHRATVAQAPLGPGTSGWLVMVGPRVEIRLKSERNPQCGPEVGLALADANSRASWPLYVGLAP